jgi:hypothetical protein
MSRPVPTTVTEKTLYDQDYLAFMASLLIRDAQQRHRFQSGMALLATWFAFTAAKGPDDPETFLRHIKLQWWADTLQQGHYADHPLLQEAPRDLLQHPHLPSILGAFRAYLDDQEMTKEGWEIHLHTTFGTMGAVIYGQEGLGLSSAFSLWGWQNHRMRGDNPPYLWGDGPQRHNGDAGVMARAVRALGPRPKNPKRPWVLFRLWAGF